MPYVYANVRKLEKQAKVGDSECVALIRKYTTAPGTSSGLAKRQVSNR